MNSFPFRRPCDEDSDELSDRDVNKLLIVTQQPSQRAPKHEGYDRTGDWTTRVKMTQDLVQAINDGLHYYEEDLWVTTDTHRGSSDSYKTVNVVSQEVFEKLAPPAPKKQNPEVPPPPPPIVRAACYIFGTVYSIKRTAWHYIAFLTHSFAIFYDNIVNKHSFIAFVLLIHQRIVLVHILSDR